MNRIVLIFLLLLISFTLYGFQFKIIDEPKEVTNHVGFVNLPHEDRYDLNNELCGMLIVRTGIEDMNIDSAMRHRIFAKEGEYWVILQRGARFVDLKKVGYVTFMVDLKETVGGIKPGVVYEMSVDDDKGYIPKVDDLVNLTISLNTEDVIITRNEKAPIIASSIAVPYRLPKGKYSFKFEKIGYETQTKDIELNEDQTLDIEMIPGDSDIGFTSPGIIHIESDPAGAILELNGQRVGPTPYEGDHYAGEYSLTLSKDLYYPVNKEFTLKAGETLILPVEKLKPRFGYWHVDSTPSGADVYLDDKLIGSTPLNRQPISSGSHEVRITLENYLNYQETFKIEDSQEKHITQNLKPDFTSLEINSVPESNADIYLDNKYLGKTPYKMPVIKSGTYNIRVEKELWIGDSRTIVIEPEKPVTEQFVLTKDFGTLIVNAPESTIYLNNKIMGKDRIEEKVKPGNYSIKASCPKHKDDERNVFVKVNEIKEIDLMPQPRIGSVSIFAVDMLKPEKKIKGADIYIDNEKSKKKTPAVIELIYGNYDVTLKHPQYLDNSKIISVSEGEYKKVTFQMNTYSGSMKSSVDLWKKNKWISMASTIGFVGFGMLFNQIGDGHYSDYEDAANTNAAIDAKKKTEDSYSMRDLSYKISVIPAVWSLYSWYKQRSYEKKLDPRK